MLPAIMVVDRISEIISQSQLNVCLCNSCFGSPDLFAAMKRYLRWGVDVCVCAFILSFIFIIFKSYIGICVCMWVCTHDCRTLRQEEGVMSPRTTVTNLCTIYVTWPHVLGRLTMVERVCVTQICHWGTGPLIGQCRVLHGHAEGTAGCSFHPGVELGEVWA